MAKEGYLLIYDESGDEVHVNLISKEHYEKIKAALETGKDGAEEAWATDCLHRWFTQTRCFEPWPYGNVKILGTISVAYC